ncbi:MAG: ABC transporter permease [Flexilinea sp.]
MNLKIMLRSSRFILGLVLVLIVVLYAVFYPLINTDDPKMDRKSNPVYTQTEGLRTALTNEDYEAAEKEIESLSGSEDESLLKVLSEINTAMETGRITKALSGSKQVKKTNPLYSEFAVLRIALGFDETIPADENAARAELEKLTAHYQSVLAVAALLKSGDKAGIEAFLTEDDRLNEEIQPILETKAETWPEAADKLVEDHEEIYKWVKEIGVRLDTVSNEEPLKALNSIQKTYLVPRDTPPNKEFPLGTDSFSRNIILEMAYGARLSLFVGLMAGIIATVIGLTLGLYAGFKGGLVDNLITTLTNTFIVIPSMVILILISVALGQVRSGWVTGLIIGLTAWPWTARAVRAQTTSLRHRDHVSMARITGYGTTHIIVTEIMPYIASYIVMAFILQVASGIMMEATLSILGLGDPTAISLGRMINWAMQYEAVGSGRWWEFVPVALCITFVTFGLYMMNSGMDEVFNPKIRS